MIKEEKGISLAQVVVGTIIVLIMGTVVIVNVFSHVEDARLASELQKIEEVKLKVLSGEDMKYERASEKDLKEEVRRVLGYHQSIGTNMEGMVFMNKETLVDGDLYVGNVKAGLEDIKNSDFKLNSESLRKLSVNGDHYYQLVMTEGEGNKNENDEENLGNELVGDGIVISSGGYHSYFKKDSENVYAWGRGSSGQLGLGGYGHHYTPEKIEYFGDVVEIDAGEYFGIVLNKSGDIYAWGEGNNGQLGLGTFVNKEYAEHVSNIENVKFISAGRVHTLALDVKGDLYGWGSNHNNQVGVTGSDRYSLPVKLGNFGEVRDLDASYLKSGLVDKEGKLFTWGRNTFGQLGHGDKLGYEVPSLVKGLEDVVDIEGGKNSMFALTESGNVFAWGINNYGQLGDGSKNQRSVPKEVEGLNNIVDIGVGDQHVIALDNKGDVYGWGLNNYRQLGIGSNVANDYETPVKIESLRGIKEVEAGGHNSFAVDSEGNVYGWGYNRQGNAGIDNGEISIDIPRVINGIN